MYFHPCTYWHLCFIANSAMKLPTVYSLYCHKEEHLGEALYSQDFCCQLAHKSGTLLLQNRALKEKVTTRGKKWNGSFTNVVGRASRPHGVRGRREEKKEGRKGDQQRRRQSKQRPEGGGEEEEEGFFSLLCPQPAGKGCI
uniref:Uncharacterized protein n=1 Tax=Micrurus lemniscatus lemniscatus TaxID=129467 RepID=A0A2D4J4Q8_MICLE